MRSGKLAENSFVLYHTACPECRKNGRDRSGDNLAVYSDGHIYCFSCRYAEYPRVSRRKERPEKKRESLPFSSTIPEKAYTWLREKNGLTLQEILDNRIQWNEDKQLLIFPVYDQEGNLEMYQGRYFGEGDYPRYITYGNPNSILNIHWNDRSASSIVVVEDFISAIKVSRVANSLPMWGSSFSLNQIKALSRIFSEIIWWVDPDKQKDYPKLVNKSSLYFTQIRCISSDFDPKYYSTEELGWLLSK